MTEETKKKLRVCAYCRVSTDEDTQATSYELQVQNYTKMIHENLEWEFAGIFADEGISGTLVLHREHFLEMIEKCKAGEIDLIITKQVSRFARNVLDSLNSICSAGWTRPWASISKPKSSIPWTRAAT